MTRINAVFCIFAAILFVVYAAPPEPVTADDVHLNAVLPEGEIVSTTKKVTSNDEPAPAASDDAPSSHLELDPEPTTDFPTNVPQRPPSYFSRLISSVFEIPIAVLTAVRNLVQTATTPKS